MTSAAARGVHTMQKKLSTPLIVGVLAAVAALLALIGYFVLRPASAGGPAGGNLPPFARAHQARQGNGAP